MMYIIIILILPFIPRLITGIYASTRIYDPDEVPVKRVGIVFGAGLTRDGSPTRVLRDRVETAAALYHAGKVEKLLMSGDNRIVEYNEPQAMYQYAIELGVPPEDIVRDFAGRRTYDTCYRARDIFQVKEAVLVTQLFHLPRSLFLCSAMGIDGVGVGANMRYYRKVSRTIWNIREIPATIAAFWDVWVSKPVPVLGEMEPIFDD